MSTGAVCLKYVESGGSFGTSLTVGALGCDRLFQVKMEREKYQSEIRDLQDQLSEMHDELDSAKKSAAADEEKDALMTVYQQRNHARLHA